MRSVLAVEDRLDLLGMLGLVFEEIGFEATLVPSATQALRELDGVAAFDLLFTDVMLGTGMNGAELAEIAREKFPAMRVLLASGDMSCAPVGAAIDAGFEVIGKPWSIELLATTLDALFGVPPFPDARKRTEIHRNW